MMALADLQAHLGCRGDIPTYARDSTSGFSEETKDIRALGWCPSAALFPLQVYLLISYEQRDLILGF